MNTAVHLVGGQALPVYMGMLYAKTPSHILVATEGTRSIAARIQRVAVKRGLSVTIEMVPPYDIVGMTKQLGGILPAEGDFLFNLTGGTKPMFAGSFSVGAKKGGRLIYIESVGRQIIDLLPPFTTQPYTEPLTIGEFLELSGYRIIKAGRWEDDQGREMRRELTKQMYTNSSKLGRLYPKRTVKVPKLGQNAIPFRADMGEISISLDKQMHGRIQLGEYIYEAEDWADIGSYAMGGWFEEYCHLLLEPYVQRGVLSEIRIGMEVDFAGSRIEKPIQELDLVLTDGFSFTIVECKAGGVKQEHVQKLENIAGSIGGTYGRGILASAFPLYGRLPDRIHNSRSVCGWTGRSVESGMADKILNQAPGTLLGSRQGKRKKSGRR